MKKYIFMLILFCIILHFPLLAKKHSPNSVKLDNIEFTKKINSYFPKSEVQIINTTLGRFASVYADSTFHFIISSIDHSVFKGYNGYSNFIIIIEEDGIVEDIILIDSDDTKPYVNRILESNILHVLSAQTIFSAERPSYLVTGATISSLAFNKSINKSLDSFKEIYKSLEFDKFRYIIPDSLKIRK